jgi:hypothetical protein
MTCTSGLRSGVPTLRGTGIKLIAKSAGSQQQSASGASLLGAAADCSPEGPSKARSLQGEHGSSSRTADAIQAVFGDGSNIPVDPGANDMFMLVSSR